MHVAPEADPNLGVESRDDVKPKESATAWWQRLGPSAFQAQTPGRPGDSHPQHTTAIQFGLVTLARAIVISPDGPLKKYVVHHRNVWQTRYKFSSRDVFSLVLPH